MGSKLMSKLCLITEYKKQIRLRGCQIIKSRVKGLLVNSVEIKGLEVCTTIGTIYNKEIKGTSLLRLAYSGNGVIKPPGILGDQASDSRRNDYKDETCYFMTLQK